MTVMHFADGKRDGNRGEQWRTLANVGEHPQTVSNSQGAGLKTFKVQAFGGSNPSPSADFRASGRFLRQIPLKGHDAKGGGRGSNTDADHDRGNQQRSVTKSHWDRPR